MLMLQRSIDAKGDGTQHTLVCESLDALHTRHAVCMADAAFNEQCLC